LFVGRNTSSAGTCATPLSGLGCELLVYDVSSTTNPVYLTGQRAGSTGSSRSIFSLEIHESTLFAGTEGFTGQCVPSTGVGCELFVYDVSSTTNLVYQTGAEAGSTAAGNRIISLLYEDGVLYVGRFTNGVMCDSVSAVGCELLVYNVSSTTNLVYQTGAEAGFGLDGASIESLHMFNSTLYVGRSTYPG
jgi:hypothetical protein